MNWVYVDESGDDGFAAYPKCSRYFILTSLSLDESSWKNVFGQLQALRTHLKQQYGLPSKTEIHAVPIMRGKVAIGKGLTWFEDADGEPDPQYLGRPFAWADVKAFFASSFRQFVLDLDAAVASATTGVPPSPA